MIPVPEETASHQPILKAKVHLPLEAVCLLQSRTGHMAQRLEQRDNLFLLASPSNPGNASHLFLEKLKQKKAKFVQ